MSIPRAGTLVPGCVKRHKETLATVGAETGCGESSQAPPLITNHPKQEETACIPSKKLYLLTAPEGGRFSFCPATSPANENTAAQQMRSHCHPELLLSYNELVFCFVLFC